MDTITLPDGRTVMLGRNSPAGPTSAPHLSGYLTRPVPGLPESVDYASQARRSIGQMYLNDRIGCCVIAGKAHAVGVWAANEDGVDVLAADAEILAAYEGICGPGNQGCHVSAVMDHMRDRGITFGGRSHRIDGYVAVDWTNPDEVKAALYLFGTLTVGIFLPSDWQQSPNVWDVTGSGIIGGHDVEAVGYGPGGVVVSTWGGLRTITWRAFTARNWVEECYVMLSPDWYDRAGRSPSGLDAAALKEDLARIARGDVPEVPTPVPTPRPTPVPTPPPTPRPTPHPPIRAVGLTLDQAIAAVSRGIEAGGPYADHGPDLATRIELAAIKGLMAEWPAAGR